jgi:hypothetical protein
VTEFRYSTSLSPLVLVTCPAHFEVASVKSVLDAYTTEVIEARRPFTLVVDATPISELPTAIVRRAITDWMKRVEVLGEQYMLGMAMVTSSSIVRGAMTAVNWIVPPRVPMTYEPTLEAAVKWSIERLEAGGVAASPALLAYRDSLRRASAAS